MTKRRKTKAQLSKLLKQKRAQPAHPKRRPSLSAVRTAVRVDRKALFLKLFASMGTVQAAADRAGIARRTVYNWIEEDEAFRELHEEATAAATDLAEREARRRGIEGVLEPVYYQGDVVGHVRKYSDTCLLAILNAYRPEKFKQRHELTGKDGGPLRVMPIAVRYDARMNPPEDEG